MFAAPRLRLFAVNSRLQPRLSMSSPRSRAASRLNQVSKHLDAKPFLELNTPFSTERTARIEDEHGNRILPKKTDQAKAPVEPVKPIEPVEPVKQEVKEAKEIKESAPEPPKIMSSQPPHPALLIPGPIEFDDAVLNSMSHYR
jgi:alanine-glyoxylate transaminase/serine-glyoxylate transaminase/serine-pyruvate transaminase